MRHPAASSDEDRAATLAGTLRRRSRSPASAAAPWSATRSSAPSALLGVPAVVMLRDLGPLAQPGRRQRSAGAGLENTVWKEGMRVIRDVVGTPIRVSDIEIGDLVNAEPAIALRGRRGRRAAHRGRRPAGRQVQGRRDPGPHGAGRHHCRPGRENWSVDGIVCYSKICTHVGCPISLYERTTHHLLCPCHQSTFDLADYGKVVFGPAARALPQLPIAVDERGLPCRAERLQRTRRTELLGAWLDDEYRHEQGRQAATAAPPPRPQKPSKAGARRHLGRRPPRPRHAREEEPPQGLPRPLVLHARRDRAVELRRPAADRRLPDALVHSRAWPRSSTKAPTTSCAASTCPRPTPRRSTSPSTSAAAC